MSDYVLTKDFTKSTGQLPDKVTLRIPAGYAWIVIKQLIIQLERCEREVEVEVFCTVEKVR